MNHPHSPRLKSLPDTPHRPGPAVPAPPTTAEGGRKGVGRKAVPSALRSDPHQPDQRLPVAWLHIVAPRYSGAAPTATSACACGYEQRATGQRQVLALIDAHTAHRTTCPLRNPNERTTAA